MKTVRFAFYVMSFVFLFSLLGMSAYAQDEVACTESNPCPATVILVVDDFAERIADDGTTTSFLPICDVNGAGQSNCENIPETWCRDSGSPYCQQAMEICSHYDECNFERLEEIQDKLTCSVSINGQNDVIIDGSPGLLTTAFRPFKPHGYYVVGLLEDLLADRLENRYLDDFTKPTGNELFASADLSWMTNIQFWEHTDPNNHKAIVVVEVDTKGFESRLIVERIATSINLFLGTPDAKKNIIVQPTNPDVDPVEPLSITVENIIINASFAVIPCGDFPSLSLDEYITNLVDVFAISDDELCPLIEETLNSFETLEGVTCDDILGGDVNQVLDTPEQYDALIKVLTGPDINDLLPQNEGEGQTYTIEDVLLYVYITQTLPQYFSRDSAASVFASYESLADGDTIIDSILHERNTEGIDYFTPLFEEALNGIEPVVAPDTDPPLTNFLVEIAHRCAVTPPPDDQPLLAVQQPCITIAAAGNGLLDQPYFPGLFNGVLGVQADYSRILDIYQQENSLPFEPEENPHSLSCYLIPRDPTLTNSAMTEFVPAMTNGGAYEADGVLTFWRDLGAEKLLEHSNYDWDITCLYGSSFAAPRVVYEAALTPFSLVHAFDAVIEGYTEQDMMIFDYDGDGFISSDRCPSMGVNVNNVPGRGGVGCH